MKLGQLIDTIIGNIFRKYSVLYFTLYEDWILNPCGRCLTQKDKKIAY